MHQKPYLRSHNLKKTKNLLAILCFQETTKEMNKKYNSAKTNYKSPQKRFFF